MITSSAATVEDPANAGIRREPELPEHEEVVAEPRKPVQEFEPLEDEPDGEAQRQRVMQRNFSAASRTSRSMIFASSATTSPAARAARTIGWCRTACSPTRRSPTSD